MAKYNYSKYNSDYAPFQSRVTSTKSLTISSNTNGYGINPLFGIGYQPGDMLYDGSGGISHNPREGVFLKPPGGGYSIWISIGSIYSEGHKSILIFENNNICYQYIIHSIDNVLGTCYVTLYVHNMESSPNPYSRGSYIGDTVAENGTYPDNGRHTDGYWYIRGSIVNSAPTTPGAFTSPVVGTILKGSSTITLAFGKSIDADGDVVKYGLYESLNSGAYTFITNLTTNTTNVKLPTDKTKTSIKWKVNAWDVNGGGSSFTESPTYTISHNTAPNAAIVEPIGDLAKLAIVDTLTPVLVHKFTDVDSADSQSAYQYVIEDLNETIVHDTGKVASTQSFFQVPVNILSWGTRYKFKVRVWDKQDVPSEYTPYEFILPNRAPNITNLQPGTNDVNTPSGTGTSPEFSWTFEDLDLEAQGAYRIKIFNTLDVLVLDTSKIFKNLSKHKIQDKLLEAGVVYYAVLTVWDPNGLSKESERAYFRTNATPTAPMITSPIDNYRVPLRPTFKGVVGTDAEDDGQHFLIQIAEDEKFETGVLTFQSDKVRTGWTVNGFDIPVEGVLNSQEGQPIEYALQVDLNRNKTYYWRMAAVDASTGAVGVYSSSKKIRVGNKLEFTLKNPINTTTVAARRILLAADYVLPSDGTNKATIKVEVTNNALDISPIWENATEQFLSMDYYNFTNITKTAENFAIGVRVTIAANDSLQPIHVDALGVTFD